MLVSPGLQISISDESQYLPTAVGTVPLVIMATAENKSLNGVLASGTTAANAGKLQIFTSQRDLATSMGYPVFQTSAAGTPLHGDELNEYGLMAAYSALGAGSQLYAVRANIDLDQLMGTSVRPTGAVPNGTYWLDLATSTWGIFEWSADTQTYTNKVPLIITSSSQTTNATQGSLTNLPTPLASIGQIGSYAVVATTNNNRIFYKAGVGLPATDSKYNTWVLVGTPNWHKSNPTITGSVTNPAITSGLSIIINGTSVTVTGITALAAANAITAAAITGVSAGVVNNRLTLYCDGTTSKSNGSTIDGLLKVTSGTLATQLGLLADTVVYSPNLQYSTYASIPSWFANDTTAAPNGSIWLKVGALGGGANLVFRKFNSLTGTWTTQASSIYDSNNNALYGLDPTAGGSNIPVGTIWSKEDPNPNSAGLLNFAGFQPRVRSVYGELKVIGNAPSGSFVSGDSFTLTSSAPGTSATTTYTISLAGTTSNNFVAAILAANIPYVTAQVESNGAISITHQAGGVITLSNIVGNQDIPTVAGFVAGVNHVTTSGTSTLFRFLSGFDIMSYTYSLTQPTANPADGTFWYYNDATTVDIMINTGTQWYGYQNVSADARGYNLANTDPAGVIVSASAPIAQSDNSALVAGDLWLDTSDLENYPMISRYNGSTWIAIDSTDQISQNGIVFADARWDSSGTTDPIVDNETDVASLLTSNYVDLDVPNPNLYPRGMLLFNTRRSGYNVKHYISDYFTTSSFNVSAWSINSNYSVGAKVLYGVTIYVATATINSGAAAPNVNVNWSELMTSAWVSASGNQINGSMYAGHKAQRQIVVEAMNAAVEANTQIREDQFNFSLICAPGYPELITNMVALNNDRLNTAFVIGDTPMSLSTDIVSITNWSNDSDGTGLATNDPYLSVHYPSGLSNDLAGNSIMVPPSHMALRTFLHNDNVSYPWFAPAGTRRGLVDNATDLGYLDRTTGEFVRNGINHTMRDALYQLNINPITIITGIGLVVWGQKTRNPVSSGMDRINVARLVTYIRTILADSGNGFLFEPNDKTTRDQIKRVIESAFNDLVAKRGVYDYVVVCDTSNNTSDRIARNELYVDVAIEPMKDVEFIYIPIRLLNPGAIAGTK